jgi:hypothetical protein
MVGVGRCGNIKTACHPEKNARIGRTAAAKEGSLDPVVGKKKKHALPVSLGRRG